MSAMDRSSNAHFATTVISLEEQLRGWLAAINRTRDAVGQVRYYSRLGGLIDFYSSWDVVPFDDAAAKRFVALRGDGIRVATMDLKIAAIALTSDALLLSANLSDFTKVPGLRVENWLQ
jgi:tRNA(fMet)-specific endonuclease VapC